MLYYYNQNYSNCTALPGGLYVYNIQDLSFLSNVTSVAGEVWIEGNPGLTLLTGLENLTSIGGNVLLQKLHDLTDLNGLANVGGNLSLYDLPEVTTLDTS